MKFKKKKASKNLNLFSFLCFIHHIEENFCSYCHQYQLSKNGHSIILSTFWLIFYLFKNKAVFIFIRSHPERAPKRYFIYVSFLKLNLAAVACSHHLITKRPKLETHYCLLCVGKAYIPCTELLGIPKKFVKNEHRECVVNLKLVSTEVLDTLFLSPFL